MRAAGWLFFLCCFVGLAVSQNSDAKKLLEAVAKRYDEAKTIFLEGEMVTVTKSPSAEQKVTTSFSLVLQKPNRFRFVLKDAKGQIQQVFVSDGTNAFLEITAMKQVLKRPAPKEGAAVPGGGILSGSLREQLSKMKEAKIVSDEKIGQRKTKFIKFVMENGTSGMLWVGDNTVWQAKVTIEGKRIAGNITPKDQPNPFVEAMKQSTVTQTISFSKVIFNPKLPQNVFAYKPPAGYKVVEKLEFPSQPKPKP